MNVNNGMYDVLSQYISKSDVYAAKVIAKVSMFIYKYRQDKKMTQKAFAEFMGVTQAMVSKWESADYNFTIETIAQISEKLNFTFDIEFIPESEYLLNANNNKYESVAVNKAWQIKNNKIEYIAA